MNPKKFKKNPIVSFNIKCEICKRNYARSIRFGIAYCGVCSDTKEKREALEKHIQRTRKCSLAAIKNPFKKKGGR